MKKLNLLLLAFLAVMGVTFQSCDDDDGYSLGDVAVDWATVNVKKVPMFMTLQVTDGDKSGLQRLIIFGIPR